MKKHCELKVKHEAHSWSEGPFARECPGRKTDFKRRAANPGSSRSSYMRGGK